MSTCKHCSTPITSDLVDFCCRGCESVYQLIHEDGLGLFYELKSGDTLSPLLEKPFQQKDWSWLEDLSTKAESSNVATLNLGLTGMSCMACVWLVETVAKKQEGVIETYADNSQGAFEVTYDVTTCNLTELAESLHKLGYELLPKKLGKQAGTTNGLIIRLGICGALAMNTMAFTLPRYNGMETSDELASLLTTIAVSSATLTLLIGGSYFFKRAWSALKLGGIHMDLPISIGLILSYAGSVIGWLTGHEELFYFDFVAIFTFLMLLGKQVQISTLNKANKRFQNDTTLPEFYQTAEGEQVDTEQLPENTTILIPPGTVVPVEARLLSEKADLSLAWITGEPEVVLYDHSAPIPAGAVNQSANAIEIQTTKALTAESSINKLLTSESKQVDHSNKQAQQKIIQIYLGVILALGLVAGGIWYFSTGEWQRALQVVISIYVVSCPCGIGLALPLLDTKNSKFAHSFGVFPLTARFWDQLTRIQKVIFDKTGTLTLDKPTLQNKEALNDLTKSEKHILLTLTRSSLHPLSRSIFATLIHLGFTSSPYSQKAEEVAGEGTTLLLENGDRYFLGKPQTIASNQGPHCQFTKNGTLITDFYFHESARSEASDSIRMLDTTLPAPCAILSGDSQERVEALAKSLGIAEYEGSLLPEDKEQRVAAIEQEHRSLYLGDGINDLPALKKASLSGAPFANINMLTADVDFLFTDETMAFLPELTHSSQQRNKRRKALILYTLLYNVVVLAVSACGLMSPLIAAIIMPVSSLLSIAIVSKPLTLRTR